jgi:ParB family chromosome partitioning protein
MPGDSLVWAPEVPVGQRDPADDFRRLPVDAIDPNPRQPRTGWDQGQLEQLAESITIKGLLEPIIVRPSGARYEIVAGERRWRACMMAGLMEIPAIIRQCGDRDSLESALIENLQRDDLNPVDEAHAYQSLMTEFGMTHDEVATRVSKDRSTITNLLRILRLPEHILTHVSRGTLSVGHARVIVGIPEDSQPILAKRIIEESWSVRQAEEWAAKLVRRRKRGAKHRRVGSGKEDNIQQIEDLLVEHFGTEVKIRRGRRGGRVEIVFANDDELSRIIDTIGVIVS